MRSNGPSDVILAHVVGFAMLTMASVSYVAQVGMPLEVRVYTIALPAIFLGVWLFGIHLFAGPNRGVRQMSVISLGAGLIGFSGCFAIGARSQFQAQHLLGGLANLGIMLVLLGTVLLITRRPREIWARKAGRRAIALGSLLVLPFALSQRSENSVRGRGHPAA